MKCTKELAESPRSFLPQNQKMMPLQLKMVMRAMFISIGGSNPLSIDHGVRNLPTPYPQRFLLLLTVSTLSRILTTQNSTYIVILTNRDPVTGL